jgi:predicted DNA-binding antitoxin AbrB/MazE fold protein
MKRNLKAIYEDGVFRPLEPVDCAEHQTVELVWTDGPSDEASLVDPEYQKYCRDMGKNAGTIEEVRQALAKIPGSLSEFIRTERDAD